MAKKLAPVPVSINTGNWRANDSRTEPLANIRGAIELYVENCCDAGDPVPTVVGKEFVEVEAA
jgi:predicted RNase H-like HicB family nuclease